MLRTFLQNLQTTFCHETYRWGLFKLGYLISGCYYPNLIFPDMRDMKECGEMMHRFDLDDENWSQEQNKNMPLKNGKEVIASKYCNSEEAQQWSVVGFATDDCRLPLPGLFMVPLLTASLGRVFKSGVAICGGIQAWSRRKRYETLYLIREWPRIPACRMRYMSHSLNLETIQTYLRDMLNGVKWLPEARSPRVLQICGNCL
jgi:hypothetical protein